MKAKGFALLCLLLASAVARAESDAQFAAIAQLAALNGVALQCHYLDQTQRIKAALVAELPKKRHLGEYFDAKTNMAFMDAITRNASCPDKRRFLSEVDAGIAHLKDRFPAQ